MPKALQIKAGKVEGARCNATAYVRFATCEEATAALAANMTIIDGAHVRVDMAAAPSSKAGAVQYEPKRSVFLGNLAFDTQVGLCSCSRNRAENDCLDDVLFMIALISGQ